MEKILSFDVFMIVLNYISVGGSLMHVELVYAASTQSLIATIIENFSPSGSCDNFKGSLSVGIAFSIFYEARYRLNNLF